MTYLAIEPSAYNEIACLVAAFGIAGLVIFVKYLLRPLR